MINFLDISIGTYVILKRILWYSYTQNSQYYGKGEVVLFNPFYAEHLLWAANLERESVKGCVCISVIQYNLT